MPFGHQVGHGTDHPIEQVLAVGPGKARGAGRGGHDTVQAGEQGDAVGAGVGAGRGAGIDRRLQRGDQHFEGREAGGIRWRAGGDVRGAALEQHAVAPRVISSEGDVRSARRTYRSRGVGGGSDRGLRDIVIHAFRTHPELARRKDVEEVVKDTPLLAWELFRVAWGMPVGT